MGWPQNSIYIIQGEMNLVVTAMRRNSRWNSHLHHDDDQDPLIGSFTQLKILLNKISDLTELTPNEFLSPFLEVIRSEDTTGPITGLALSSINKFLSYGLIDAGMETAAAAIENIADAVTHARFVGTDPSSDEVVLMKILHVLRTLLLTPAGTMLTNESVCEIMQSCFRICFEMRLSELLRKSAEHTLMDMVQLLFSRLPQFKEDDRWVASMKKLKMRTGAMDPSRTGKHKKRSPKPHHRKMPLASTTSQSPSQQLNAPEEQSHSPAQQSQVDSDQTMTCGEVCSVGEENTGAGQPGSFTTSLDEGESRTTIATTPVSGNRTVVDIQSSFKDASEMEHILEDQFERVEKGDVETPEETETTTEVPSSKCVNVSCTIEMPEVECEDSLHEAPQTPSSNIVVTPSDDRDGSTQENVEQGEAVRFPTDSSDSIQGQDTEYVNPRGVRFTSHQHTRDGSGPLIPYGLPCVRELFRFLISLTSPIDRHNTDVMIHMGLSLLTVALESGADHLASFNSLLYLLKDDLCKNLLFLLQSERISLFAASIRVCFLLFESTRSHLKFQLEAYVQKLMDVVVTDSPRVSYEQREIALEAIVQLLRIPGLVTELYLNYDCDLYCSNLFEDLMKLLSKNAFPVSGLFTTHLLSLDALLVVLESIEQHCHHRMIQDTNSGSTTTTPDSGISPNQSQGEEDVEMDGKSISPDSCSTNTTQAMRLTSTCQNIGTESDSSNVKDKEKRAPKIRPNRMKVSVNIPTEEELAAIKHKKKLFYTGTEQFNQKPSKGIEYMQQNGLLVRPLDPGEVVTMLKENPRMSKKQIGEFISNKKNTKIMEAFQKSFYFEDVRIDEALRTYLETFRLPGEAPVISYLLECFAEHWHKTNGEPFANADCAFTLAYAVIMLNVDQHNTNAKKQNIPMTCEEFKKNLAKVNGNKDFDQEMLDEVYAAIKSDEIVMPEEQSGIVRENYMWKILLRRGAGKEGLFIHAPTGMFDRDLFTLVWGPTVAALSFVFDKSAEDAIIQKATLGFKKCATIAARYAMSDVFDNLVISLCKFTTLLSSAETAESIPINFGNNSKAQLAAKTVFGLAHRHGDILREGWKNILDCLMQLYRAKLLPDVLVQVEDFLDPAGRVSLIKEDPQANQKPDSGVLSSFYSYFTLTETASSRGPTPEEEEASRRAASCLQECHLDQLLTESKFLQPDALRELLKALVSASRADIPENGMDSCDDDAAVFFLELLIKVVLQNRDRIGPHWHMIREHLYNLMVNATEQSFLVERAVVGMLRIAIRLLRREEIASQVLSSLRILLSMKPVVIHSVARQVAYGLHDLLRTNAANIHGANDWATLFSLLEVVGAGASPPPLLSVGTGVDLPQTIHDAGAQSDSEISSSQMSVGDQSDRGYTSDSELYDHQRATMDPDNPKPTRPLTSIHGSWLMVDQEDVGTAASRRLQQEASSKKSCQHENQYDIVLNEELRNCDTKALTKSCETLAFLVRDAAHVTPHNFESCVHCIRTFVEASINGGNHLKQSSPHRSPKEKKSRRHRKGESGMKKSKSTPSHIFHGHESDDEQDTPGSDGFHSLSIQLLDLMHTLHTRAASIFSSWAAEAENEADTSHDHGGGATTHELCEGHDVAATPAGSRVVDVCNGIKAGTSTLWTTCWCPLLQGIARLCCDSRRQVRSQALTYLQRALLVHDLQTLSAVEWEACFNKVLFPLLSKLLDTINPQDPSGIEETRMRASTLLCKVFLQHLSPLLSLATFTALWLTILEFMDKYMHVDQSDLLCEAIPESLKNMLLVMHTAGILQSQDNQQLQLWQLTWDRINTFLPNLHRDVFKPHELDSRSRSREGTPQDGVCSSQPLPTKERDIQQSAPSSETTKPPGTALPTEATQSSQPQCSTPPSESPTSQSPPSESPLAAAPQSPPVEPHAEAAASSNSTSPVLSQESTGGAANPDSQPDSPSNTQNLTAETNADMNSGVHYGKQYILHPPLPLVSAMTSTAGGAVTAAIPLLLNPDIMQGTSVPILSPQVHQGFGQGTPERKTELTVERQ